jgi:AhpD family alkylhydroperoxidase|tara:strand:- start:290 stop:655 length:366 start_codon:yes stop_codon:yes gene_type:complete
MESTHMSWPTKIETTRQELRALNALIPDTARAFGGLGKAVKEGGTLDFKVKEFVALGIAVATKCEPCIALHIEALLRIGATREEVGDVLAMSIQMGGGPAMMYAAKALACYDELSEKGQPA